MQHSTSDKKTNVYLGLLTRLKYSLRLGGYCGLLNLFYRRDAEQRRDTQVMQKHADSKFVYLDNR